MTAARVSAGHAGGRRAAAVSHRGALAPIPQDWPHRSASRFVEAAGTRWHVQRMGAGPPLLLVHGTASSTHTWRATMPLLAADFDVLAIDLPGHGFSGRLPEGAMTLPAVAGGLGALLEAEGFAPVHAVGHSAGAAILLAMSVDGLIAPRCIVGLNAALKPFGGMLHAVVGPVARALARSRLLPYLLARRAQDPAAVRRVLASTGSTLDDEGVSFYGRLLRRRSHTAAVLTMMAAWDLAPLLARLPALEPRLYLVVANGDRAVRPEEARAVARRVPAAEIFELEGGGHLAHEERPAEAAALIRSLCTQGAPPPDGVRVR